MKWNECSCSEKHTCCNCIFWNLFLGGWGWRFMYFISKILWSQIFPREILRNLQFLTDKTWEVLPLVPHPTFPPFLSFNLLVKLMVAIREVCQRVYRCMCVYCMYANITEGHILIKISVVIQLISFSLAWVVLQSQGFETDHCVFNSL